MYRKSELYYEELPPNFNNDKNKSFILYVKMIMIILLVVVLLINSFMCNQSKALWKAIIEKGTIINTQLEYDIMSITSCYIP